MSATVDFVGLSALLPEPEPEPANGENGDGEEPAPAVRGRAWRWSMTDRVWTERAPGVTHADLLAYIAALENRVAELEAAQPPEPEPEPEAS